MTVKKNTCEVLNPFVFFKSNDGNLAKHGDTAWATASPFFATQ